MLEWTYTGDTFAASQDGVTYTVTPIPGAIGGCFYLLLSGMTGSWGKVFDTLDAALSEAEQTAAVYRRIVSLQTGQEDHHV